MYMHYRGGLIGVVHGEAVYVLCYTAIPMVMVHDGLVHYVFCAVAPGTGKTTREVVGHCSTCLSS